MRRALLVASCVLLALPPLAFASPAPWADGTVSDTGLPTGPDARHFRVHLRVAGAGAAGLRDLPVQAELDLTAILAAAGYPSTESELGDAELQGFTLDLSSLSLHEVDAEGAVLPGRIALRALPVASPDGRPFDPSSNPRVLALWVMPGVTTGDRLFDLYLDSLAFGAHAPPAYTLEETLPLATAFGPGRGTRLYVPLQDLPGKQGETEARRVWVTNLAPGANQVKVFEYDGQGRPRGAPVRTLSLNGVGDAAQYVLGDGGQQASPGSVLLVADRPIEAEALAVPASARASFKANAFLPSSDGGFWGRQFTSNNPGNAETWVVHCPGVLAATTAAGRGCTFSLDGAQQPFLKADRSATLDGIGGGVHSVAVAAGGGSVAVQRLGRGLAAWPAADGPTASRFLGQAGASDDLLLSAQMAGTCLKVDSFGPGQPQLTRVSVDRLCIGPGAFDERASSWGTGWGRTWETGNTHLGGPVTIQGLDASGAPLGGLQVASGPIGDRFAFTSLVTPQSPDGGLSYDVAVPSNGHGGSLGRLVLFAPFAGTSGTARLDSTGETLELGPLLQDTRVDLPDDRPGGYWHVRMDRPVLLSWLKPGLDPFGGFAAGLTAGAPVSVLGADYAGPALEVDTESRLLQGQAGGTTTFRLHVRNLARTVLGDGLEDNAHVAILSKPEGWEVRALPGSLPLGAGAEGVTEVLATLPSTASTGDRVVVRVSSDLEPRLAVDETLFLNLATSRAVDVLVDGKPEAKEELVAGEAGYHAVTITNRGTVADAYTLELSAPLADWGRDLVPVSYSGDALATPVLGPGESAEYTLNVTAPQAGTGQRMVTTVVARSVASTSVRGSARLIDVVGGDRRYRVDVDAQTLNPAPGETATFRVTVTSLSDLNLDLRTSFLSTAPTGWGDVEAVWSEQNTTLASLGNKIGLEPAGHATLLISRHVPSTAHPYDTSFDRLRLRQVLGGQESPATDTPLRVRVAPVSGFRVTGPDTPVPALPGKTIEVPFTLTSAGNVAQDLGLSAAAPEGWALTDSLGRSGPWNVTLDAGASLRWPLRVAVPEGTLPGDSRAALFVAAVGQPVWTAAGTLRVAPLAALRADNGTATLSPGRATVVPVLVHNAGNVGLQVTAQWVGLPSGFRAVAPTVLVPAHGRAEIPALIEAPREGAPGAVQAKVRVVASDASATAEAAWRLLVGGPRLQVERLGAAPVAQAQVYTFKVSNTGGEPAYNVTARLVASNGTDIDAYTVLEILPGRSATVALVAASPEGVRFVLSSDDAPDGQVIELSEAQEPGRSLPMPGAAVLTLAVAALALALRRRPT